LPEKEKDQFLLEVKKEQLAGVTKNAVKNQIATGLDEERSAEILLRIAQLFYLEQFGNDPIAEGIFDPEDTLLEGLSISEDFEEMKNLFDVLKSLVKQPPFTAKRSKKGSKKNEAETDLSQVPEDL
jgi:hypothetical protein